MGMEDVDKAKRFLFWAFVASLVLLQLSYTYIIYRQHQRFLRALQLESLCGKKMALERETVRYQLRQQYLFPEPEEIDIEFTRYNNWRLWVIWMPAMIAIALFMVVKFGMDAVPPVYYFTLSVIGLYLGFTQMYELPSQYGFPSFWSWKAFQFGKIHQIIEYHTQAYSQIHALFDVRLEKCLDENAEYSCMERMPAKLKETLVRRYVSVHPDSNVYQAAEFFEEALKKKHYDAVIGYMRLSEDSTDLQELVYGDGGSVVGTLGASDEWLNALESGFGNEIIGDLQKIYTQSFWTLLVLGWVLIVYFTWFHLRYNGLFEWSVNPVIWVIVIGWFFHYFIL